MRHLAACLTLLALGACAIPPQGVDEAARLRFTDAVASMGCELVTEPHFLATELQAGLTRDQVIGMIRYHEALGQAAPKDGGGFVFTTGACGNAA